MNNLPHLNEFSLLKSSSQPELVRRSSNSAISPLDFKLSPTNILINGQHQNYVIVDGKKFNVKRSSQEPSPKSPPVRASYNGETGFMSEEKEKLAAENYVPLKRALDNANSLIARQSTQILRQVRQIERLTQQLHLDQFKENTPERHVAFLDDSNSADLTSTSVSSSRTGSLTSSRRRVEAIESGQKLNVLTEMDVKRSRSLPCNASNSFRGSDMRNADANDRNCSHFARLESGCATPPHETLLPELPMETRGQDNNSDRSPSVLSDLSLSPPPMLRKPYSLEAPLGGRSMSISESATPHQPSILRKPQSFERPVKNVPTAVHEDSTLSPPMARKQHSLERPLSGVSTPTSEEISLPMLRIHQSIERPLNSASISSHEDMSLSPPPILRKHLSQSQERPLSSTSTSVSISNYEEMSLSPPPMLRKPQSLERPLCGAKAPMSSEFSTGHLPATARPPKGLAARLSMGAREKPKASLNSTLKRRTPGGLTRTESALSENGPGTARTVDSESSEIACKTECSFFWKSSNQNNVHLFIAHDNPQVGSTVANRMKNEGPMHVMIETKEKSGLICFVLASIVYSGCIEAVEGADLERPRGSQFIVCSRMTAIKIDLATLPKRANGDILEIDLQFGIQQGHVDISSVLKVKEFLGSCIDRVNVILDPSHTQMWYPYFEGNRKMAPQFRSKGVGYIRLGDEFSNYGSAFISLDAGLTYLDNGATSIVADKGSDKSPAVLRTFPGALLQYSDMDNSMSSRSQKSGMGSTMSRSGALRRSISSEQSIDISDNDESGTQGLSSSSSSMRIIEPFSLVKETDEINESLNLLSDPDLKWSDRVEALRRLHSAVINISNACPSGLDGLVNPGAMLSPNLLMLVTSALVLCITKQMNPHVLRSAVCCVRVVGAFAGSTHSCGVTWRALLLETVHLLRSSAKAVYEEAKDTLLGLQCGAAHCARWTVCINQLNPLLGDIFAGPKKGGVACNSSKVLQWLESIVNNEIDSHVDSLIHKSSRTVGVKPCEKADIGAVFVKCTQHLVHREEVTREAAVCTVGALLVCDILQSLESSSTGWQELCELSGRVSKQAPKVATTLASRLSQTVKDDSSSQLQSAVEIMFISALSSASAAAVNALAKDVRRMHDRVVAYSIKLLESKIKEGKTNIEKELAEKQACSEDTCADGAFGNGEGIAFRNKTHQCRQDVIVECTAITDIDSESRETDPEDVLTPLVELDEKEKLTSDWFAFKEMVHEAPTVEDSWNELCQVRHCL
jgi:hypothetical protein